MADFEPDGADGSYVEGTPLVRLLGSPGKAKVLAVFLGKHYEELSAAQVADLAGVDVSTFHRNVDPMLETGVVEETRQVGGTQLYGLNTDSQVAKALGQARSALLDATGSNGEEGECSGGKGTATGGDATPVAAAEDEAVPTADPGDG